MRRIIVPSLALLVLLAACGGGTAAPSTVAPTTATTTTAPTTTTTTTVPVALDELVWSRLPLDEEVFGGSMLSTAVANGPGLLVVGSGEGSGPAVWSSDGIAWTRVGAGAAGAEDPVWVDDVVVAGPGFVAIGSRPASEDVDVIVWTSADGNSWAEAPDATGARGGSGVQNAFSLAVGGPGLVAVGFEEYEGQVDGVVWTSPDGLTWTRVPDGQGVFGGPGEQRVFAVTAGGPGLVAVGEESGADGIPDIAVWVSPDGFAWTRVVDDAGVLGGPGEQSAFSVVAGGPGLVMVGRVSAAESAESESDGAVWWSADGSTWERGDPDGALGGPGSQTLVSLVATANGLVAAGRDESENGQDSTVWVSTDGITWVEVSADPAVFGGEYSQYARGVTVWESGIVIVGWEQSASHLSSLIWVGRPPEG